MEAYPLLNKSGDLFAFEIPNSYFPTSGSVSRFFAKCPGVEITKVRKLYQMFREEMRSEFLIDGTLFEIWEPYGDNSRFWVGPAGDNPQRVAAIDKLYEFVQTNWPGPVSKLRGIVLAWFR